MIQSPEVQNKIAQYRAKAATGNMTIEEWREALQTLRQSRSSAQAASSASKSRKAAAKAPVDTGALLGSLKALAGK